MGKNSHGIIVVFLAGIGFFQRPEKRLGRLHLQRDQRCKRGEAGSRYSRQLDGHRHYSRGWRVAGKQQQRRARDLKRELSCPVQDIIPEILCITCPRFSAFKSPLTFERDRWPARGVQCTGLMTIGNVRLRPGAVPNAVLRKVILSVTPNAAIKIIFGGVIPLGQVTRYDNWCAASQPTNCDRFSWGRPSNCFGT